VAPMSWTHLAGPDLGPGTPRLVVTGLMGTGKTVAGREVARELGMPFVDLDEVIERRTGRSVADIFAQDGEAAFRQVEREVIRDAARVSGIVVATGGGAVLHAEPFARLADGAVVAVLAGDPEALAGRLGSGEGRPLLAGDPAARIADISAERAAAYAAAGPSLDTTGLSPEATVAELARRYRERAGSPRRAVIEVPGPSGTYPVVLGPGAMDRLARAVSRVLPDAKRAVVVADAGAAHPWATVAARSAAGDGLTVDEPILLPSGEQAKTAATLEDLWTRFCTIGLTRHDPVIAVGGGATLDVAGFAAATFSRGVPLVNVPTTLLAMVDGSLGGKVGIDHAGAKNMVGTFHHPAVVVADLEALGTLPDRALRAGLAECVKAGLVASPLVIDVLEQALEEPGDPVARMGLVAWLAEQAIRIKAAYVREDPFDRELRHALNLGHTFAHAIESATGYSILHGEAVAIGLVAAARLGSAAVHLSDGELAPRLERMLPRLGLPIRPPEGVDPIDVLEAFGADKKRRARGLTFVVPAPDGAHLVHEVDPEDALSALGLTQGASAR
jgi:shikimate kinase / 3-dehydroquinate synthase